MCREKTPWEKTVEFHGHVCPGLVIGFRAATLALEKLGVSRAGDEELVAIVENDACGVDALQVVTGCTFGKGNLIFRDWGKQVFTVLKRRDGKGVRVALRPGLLDPALPPEEKIARLWELPAGELFSVREVDLAVPERARLFPTLICASCGEGVMEPRAKIKEGKIVCPACAQAYRPPLLSLS